MNVTYYLFAGTFTLFVARSTGTVDCDHFGRDDLVRQRTLGMMADGKQ